MTPAELRKRVEATLLAELGPRGFLSRRGCLLRARTPVAWDWIAIQANGRRSDKRVDVLLNVGIHCVPLHQLLAELEGTKPDDCVATFALNLGYLGHPPRPRDWPFEIGEPEAVQLVSLLDEVVRVALPFQERFTDLASIRAGCVEHGLALHQGLRLPALDFLMGDLPHARAGLEGALAKVGPRADLSGVEFRRQAALLLERCGIP